MKRTARKLIVYIASSLDGFIAAPGGDLRFLDRVQLNGEDYGYGAFMSTIDTVIIGRKTYDWVMEHVELFPHSHLKTFVITRSQCPDKGNINFYNGDLSLLVSQLKSVEGKDIFCDGGAQVVNELLQLRMVDEIILSVIPVLLGDGIRLFSSAIPVQDLQLIASRSFTSGLVQLHYRVLH